MARNRSTYWVEFSYKFLWYAFEEDEWVEEDISESQRIQCRKTDIKKEVKKIVDEILKEDYGDVETKDLRIVINDFYLTTDYEV